MTSRKSHPKSRNGCPQCKKRRIKCNEEHPRCSNCRKHDIECGFETYPPKSAGLPPATKRRRSSDEHTRRSSIAEHSPIKRAHTKSKSPLVGEPLRPLHMDELELLHHFTTETSQTLSDRPESHYLWRSVAPQIAFEREYLMRGILSIAALHLSTLRPERHDHYAQIAVRQQDAALGSFRSIMENPDETHSDAFFAMASLIVVYGFESPRASSTLGMFDYRQQSDKWLPLIRGVNSVLMSRWPSIKKGRLSGLLHDHAQPPPSTELPGALDEKLRDLEELCSRDHLSDDDKEACKTATLQLQSCFVRIYNKTSEECEVSIAFLWPVMIPQHFLELIFDRKAEALIILAYYCTILHHLTSYWWLQGWGRQIVGSIRDELDVGLRDWVNWPLRVVGLLNGTDGAEQTEEARPKLSPHADDRHHFLQSDEHSPGKQLQAHETLGKQSMSIAAIST